MSKISLNDRIFIAGASGMAGNAIKKTLLKKGYGRKDQSGLLFTPTRKELNLLDNNEVKNWFQRNKPNIVIIAAAKVGGIQSNAMHPADFLLENLRIQNNLIENAWIHEVKRLLFLGSSCIYPKFATQPISEEDLLNGYLEKTNEFIKDAADSLHDKGIFIAQLMCLKSMIEKYDLGNICHEHIEFYSIKSLKYLFENNGLEIFLSHLKTTTA